MNAIDRAREHIERVGWYQKGRTPAFANGVQTACVVTAMRRAEEDDALRFQAYDLICSEIGIRGGLASSVYTWNDAPSTTLEDVLLVMKRASARLDEETAS